MTYITLRLVFFATLLIRVEDLVTEGTCVWICNTESDDLTSRELEQLISQESFIKLKLHFNDQVDKTCANLTLNAYNKSMLLPIWVKKMSDTSPGELQSLAQTLFEAIYSGQVLLGNYKHINVCCTFTASKKSTTNHFPRISLHNSQSVMYYVEQFGNYSSKREKFLTIMRMEEQILITGDVPVTSKNNSVASAKHKQLIVSVAWVIACVFVVTAQVLYSPVLLLSFSPSEVLLQVTPKEEEKIKDGDQHPAVQKRKPITPTENDNRDSLSFFNGITPALPDETQDEGNYIGLPSQSDPYDSNSSEMVPRKNIKTGQKEDNPQCRSALTGETDFMSTEPLSAGFPAPKTVATTSDGRSEYVSSSHSGTTGNSIANSSGFQRTNDVKGEKECSQTNVIEMPETSGSTTGQRVASRSTDENFARMILVDSTPVTFGGWIGNELFTNSSQYCVLKDLVKFVIINFFPVFLLSSLGDISLLLIKFNSPLAYHFPDYSLTGSVLRGYRIWYAILFLFFFCMGSFYERKLLSRKINYWKPCFAHNRHLIVYKRFKCLWHTCDECKDSPPECPVHLDIPSNIVHNIEKQPERFVKHCIFFWRRFVIDYFMATEIHYFKKIVFVVLLLTPAIWLFIAALLVINFAVDIILSSPIICLCQARMSVLKKIFNDEFRGANGFEFLIKIFFFTWQVYYFTRDAVDILTATMSFFNLLKYNFTKELLPHVIVVFLAYYFCWSCYTSFKAPYGEVVKELYRSYKKKFDKLEKEEGPHKLVCYEQGDHANLIPSDLFEFAIEHKKINLPIRNGVGKMMLKILALLLLFTVIFPVIPTAPSYESVTIVVTFLIVCGNVANNHINSTKYEILEEDIDQVVDDFIKKKN